MMCVCDKIELNGKWMDGKWIEWMWRVDVESGCGKWKVEGGAVPDLTIV